MNIMNKVMLFTKMMKIGCDRAVNEMYNESLFEQIHFRLIANLKQNMASLWH